MMKIVYTLLFCLVSAVSFSQEKNIDQNAMSAKLANVQAEIVALEERISMIQIRIDGMAESEVTPELQNVMVNLNSKLDKLKRVEFSTKAYLDGQAAPKIKNNSND